MDLLRGADRDADYSVYLATFSAAGTHSCWAAGASRNAVVIEASQSLRPSGRSGWCQARIASWERGRPTMSPGTPPPGRRRFHRMSGDNVHRDDLQRRVWSPSSRRSAFSQSIFITLATSVGQFSGLGAALT
jgi:hypothetical protein